MPGIGLYRFLGVASLFDSYIDRVTEVGVARQIDRDFLEMRGFDREYAVDGSAKPPGQTEAAGGTQEVTRNIAGVSHAANETGNAASRTLAAAGGFRRPARRRTQSPAYAC